MKEETKKQKNKKTLDKRFRLAVFRSNKYIYAQIIDDQKGYTLVSCNEKELDKKDLKGEVTNIKKASLIGELLAEKAKKSGVKKIKFDRRSYKYHGRVKALAEGARKGGLEF